jgi:hypothetical protein
MSDPISRQVDDAQQGFIKANKKQIAAGIGITTAIAIAVVAMILAVIAYSYYMDLESKVSNIEVKTTDLIESSSGDGKNSSEVAAEIAAEASIFKNGTGTANANSLDPLELEGDINAAAAANIEGGILETERMYAGRYYTELDDASRA